LVGWNWGRGVRETGAVRYRKELAVGVLTGLLVSVFPFECFFAGFIPLGVALGLMGPMRKLDRLARLGAMAAPAVVIGTLAVMAPLKYVDRNHLEGMKAPCTTVAEVAKLSRAWLPDEVAAIGEREVCLSSVRPTLREVERAMKKQAGVGMEFGYCGNGATLLMGGEPIGGPMFSVAGRK